MWNNINDRIIISSAEPEDARFKFKCRKCGHTITTDPITIPAPNFAGDKDEESRVYEEEGVVCPKCGEEHEIKISNSYGGVDADIDEVKDIFVEPV